VSAHTWCAIAALRLRQGDAAVAGAAFERALVSVPGYALALAGQSSPALGGRLEHLRAQGASVEAAMVEAVGESLTGRHAAAASLVHAALQAAPVGSSGWMLPVEPFLRVAAHPAEWAPVLALLRSRSA
jgi:hypothetical protein